MTDHNPVCIIGVGNRDCGDDGIGPCMVDLLAKEEISEIKLVKASGETAGLIEILSENSSVIMIDALAMQTQAGVIHRFDASVTPLPSEFFSSYSTHSMGVDEAIEMARVLGEVPETMIVYGMEGIHFEAGDPMSVEVSENLNKLRESVRSEIQELQLNREANSN